MYIKREHLYRLIDQIPDTELIVVQRYLEFLCDADPIRSALAKALLGIESEINEEVKQSEKAESNVCSNRTISTSELQQRLGL